MCIVTIVSKNVKRLRLERGLSQEALANEAEVHRNYLGRIEHGDYSVGIINLDKIAHALQVPISSLLEEQGEPHEKAAENIHP